MSQNNSSEPFLQISTKYTDASRSSACCHPPYCPRQCCCQLCCGCPGLRGATGDTNPGRPQGTCVTGQVDRSAYQVAVGNGYKRSEKEYLESMVHSQGLESSQEAAGSIENSIGLQMQSQRNHNLIVGQSETAGPITLFPFDTILFDNNNGDIKFDSTENKFTLSGPAIYKIDWEIAYSSALYANGTKMNSVEINLAIRDGNFNRNCLASRPLMAGQICGSAIIQVTSNSAAMWLVPLIGNVTLADVHIQANITIVRI